jgi:hypothetical protein
MTHLDTLRVAAAATTLSIPTSEKRKAKQDVEPDKKKVKVSQGVRALEKVSTRGMKDMRSFFKKPVKTAL